MERLHSATRAVVSEHDADVALARAIALAACPPKDWRASEWLTIAAAANAQAVADPRWYKVKVLACEQWSTPTSPTDALWARAQLLISLGVDETDRYRSSNEFVQRALALIQTEAPQTALVSYRDARSTILSVARETPAWEEARARFLRCRQLREFANIVHALISAGHVLPPSLERWSAWKNLREEDFSGAGV
ncbi:MAG: hypothetical protein ACOY0T_41110 [Myxococcota bacterium]